MSKVSVLKRIHDAIRDHGPISFAHFMDIALYSPDGYYEKQKQIGREGDFYTSVSVGPLFGELLARQMAVWLWQMERPTIVEAGAHDGRLARDILNWLSVNERALFDRLEYAIFEPSVQRLEWQRQTLATFENRVSWHHNLFTFPKFSGVLFSNELLDAMRFHRLIWDKPRRQWMEKMVGLSNGKLVWVRRDLSEKCRQVVPLLSDDLADVLPMGFTIDVSPDASFWWSWMAGRLKQGRLIAIDYGLVEEEFFRPDRFNGTARAYFKHHVSDDLLANPGEQDITAHVNWSAIQRTGEQEGLETETFGSQEQFIMNIVKTIPEQNWSAEQIKQLKTLTHPSFLGRAFRVLVQKRD
jgi:SAM-dependent MidA family methyltransferase